MYNRVMRAMVLFVMVLFVGCGDRPMSESVPIVVCSGPCQGQACDLCIACRDTPGASFSARCPDNSGVCDLPLPGTCEVKSCTDCP